MKKTMIYFGIFLLSIIYTNAAEPLVLNDDKMPLILSIDSLPEFIGKSLVTVNYNWVDWSKSEFEEKQNAAGNITYSFRVSKFCGGRHIGGGKIKLKSFDSGVLKLGFNSYIDDKGGYGTGPGRYSVSIYCSYKGKDGKRHTGTIGHLTVNVNFIRPI